MVKNLINEKYGGYVRLRVCGLCIVDQKILMVKHQGLGPAGALWVPPGGGADFRYDCKWNLAREFKEETGLEVEIGSFQFAFEYINPPLHSVELFFHVEKTDGILKKGTDPEFDSEHQIISEVAFLSFETIKAFNPQTVHGIFPKANSLEELLNLRGYFTNLA